MTTLLEWIFVVDAVMSGLLLAGAVWSVAFPSHRIWPPPGPKSWQYQATWVLFYVVFASNAALFVLDWNGWVFDGGLRFVVGVPTALLGTMFVSWGIATLGVRNTSGQKAGFVTDGPYRFSRNPQYVGDIVLFIGLSVVANSSYLWVTHALVILTFVVTPLAEETWLDAQYGEDYVRYRRGTSRFL